jgi:arylsulfatase A-like enzyme
VTSPDFYPTILDALGLPLMPEQHVDGVSFLSALRGEPFARGPVYWHYPHYSNQGGTPGCAIRDGRWKLIQFFEYDDKGLFDLEKEPEEDRNLAVRMPDKTAELSGKLSNWLREVDARIPIPNPDWEE